MKTLLSSGQRCLSITFLLALTLTVLLFPGSQCERSFDGFSVLRINPDTKQKLEFLKSVAFNFDNDVSYVNDVDFWKRPRSVNETVDLMVSPSLFNNIQTLFNSESLNYHILIDNVQQLIEREKSSNTSDELNFRTKGWNSDSPNAFFQDYHRFNEIQDYMSELARENQDIVKLQTIGQSYEGRPMQMWIISNDVQTREANDPKPIIWIDSGIHAREWISPATGLFIATQLIRKSDSDPVVNDLLDKFEFHMLPVSNPDGYEWTHTQDRMWRKTRSRSGTGWDIVCRGTDPNRNWGFHWNEAGASSHPCSDIYAGQRAFSEPETKAMSDYVMKIRDQAVAYITLHSYSQLILTPWGFTKDLPEAYPDLERVAQSAASALKSMYQTEYTVGSSTNVLYAAAGGSDDWAHGVAGIKYSYTIELRDSGKDGFVLPKEQIIETGDETFAALIDIAHNIGIERGLYDDDFKSVKTNTTAKPVKLFS